MKKLFTLICLCVLAASTSWAQLVYTEFDEATGTLTYYYDTKKSSRSGITEVYNPPIAYYASYQDYRFRDYNEKVKKAVIDLSMKDAPLTSTLYMFNRLKYLVRIEGLANLNTANVIDMYKMFEGCSSLTSLNLSSFNTQNVKIMSCMFSGCYALTSLDLSSFNTAKVTDMSEMFKSCKGLTSLDLSSFNTAEVRGMNSMFFGCSGLTSLDLSSFNTANVWYMIEMFYGCRSLTSLNLSSFNTKNVMDMSKMFSSCSKLTSLDLSSFNTAKVTNMSSMFYGCSSLTSLDLISFNITKVTDMSEMFKYCNNLTTIFCDDDWSASSVLKSSSDMFYNCNALVGGKGTKYDSNKTGRIYARPDSGTSNPGYFTGVLPEYGIFVASSNPTTGLEYDFINATEFVYDDGLAAYVATVGTEGNPASWVSRVMISNVRGRENRFKAATIMTSGMINGTEHTWLNYTETPNAEILLPAAGVWRIALDDYNRKINFYQIEGDEILEVYTEFDESTGTLTYYYDNKRDERKGVTEVYNPIKTPDALRFNDYNHKIVKAVIDPSMKNAPLTSTNGMFYGGTNTETFSVKTLYKMTTIEGLGNLNTAIMTDMQSMFFSCSALTMLDLSSFNTSKVTSMNGMFLGCNKLEVVDVSSFDISNVTDLYMMFSGCTKLKTIYCSNDWSTSTAQCGYMFSVCNSLVGGKGTVFDGKVIDNTYARPDGGTDSPGYFTADTMTRINSLTPALSKGEGAIYNLSGQRVNKPVQKGLYIINGKKMMVK